MRCTHCGANIPDDQLICPVCGAEVQIVPDYNPLEDVLAREVKGSVAGATRQIQADVVRRQNMSQNQQNRNRQDQRSNPSSTRVLSQAELDKVREERREQLRRQRAQRQRQKTDAKRYQDARQSAENLRRTSTESRRLQQIKKQEAARKKRQKLLTVFFLLILLVGVGIYIGYQNSYTGMIKKGNAALQNSNYTSAENYFNRAIIKDKSKAEVSFCMCFPDVYEIGMSHLGIQILYDMFNRRDDVWCERVYSPWTDLDKIMREEHIPLFTLESQDPVKDFDFLGITLGYEMCYTNVLQLLDLSGIALLSADREENDPVIIGGGACAYNPEPLAEFFDLFYIGEGETVYDALFDAYKANKKAGGSRSDFLLKAAQIPGIYVPSLYEVTYKEDGTIESFHPTCEGVSEKVEKQLIIDMDKDYNNLEAPVVPHIKATQDRVTLEIQRGCIRGCRFCQAGMIYRPTRERDVEKLKKAARTMLQKTGHEEISLSSLSSSDYSHLKEIVNFLIDEFRDEAVNISLPSLRIDAFALDVMSKVQDVKKSSLTFAPEAGSQRLRNVINKGLTEEDILHGAGEAFKGGWNQVKLYFMLGLPTETEDDMKGIAHLAQKIAETYYETVPKEQRKGKVQINVSTSFFVPKPFTPFQWAPMFREEDFIEKAKIVKNEIRSQLNQRSIRYNWHEPDVTVLEGFLARGDRRCSKVILKAYEKGALYDAWSESFHYDIWKEAFKETGVDIEFYTLRERSTDEILPWDFIDAGVTKKFLIREWEQAKAETVTPNCRQKCSGCGVLKYKGGVCCESKN